MIVLKIILFTLVTILVCYCTGNAVMNILTRISGEKRRSGLMIFAGGNAIIILGCLIFGIAGCIGMSAKYAFVLLVLLLSILFIASAFYQRKNNRPVFNGIKIANITDKKSVVILIFFALLVVGQVIFISKGAYNNSEAIKNIPIATRVFERGNCIKGSSIMNLWGSLAMLIKIHPLMLIYTYLPSVMLLLVYTGYYEFAYAATDGKKTESIIVVAVVTILNIWGYQSEVFVPATLLFSWFSGWCYIVHILPVFIAILILTGRENGFFKPRQKEEIAEEEMNPTEEDYQEEWDMKKHKIINARNLAIALGLMAVLLVAVVLILNNKINQLHAATANLQVDLNNRCRVYEFEASNGEVCGYLIKGKDEKLTMIGGGGEERADDLYNFISEYGTVVTNWYLYDISEENVGACVKCISEKGIEAQNVYVLNRTEIEGL